jgi:hypothetical protein
VVAGSGRSRRRCSTPVVADLRPSGNGEEADLAAASCVDEEADLPGRRASSSCGAGCGVVRRQAAEPAGALCVVELRSRPGRRASSSCGPGQGVVRRRGADPAEASCVVEVWTRPGRRAPSRGGPDRGVTEEAPVAVARVLEERERPRGEGENEWVGGISGISYSAPALCAHGGWANDIHKLATGSMTCGSQLAWAHTSDIEGYRLNVSRRVVVGGCSQVGGLSGGGWAAERDRQVGPVLR